MRELPKLPADAKKEKTMMGLTSENEMANDLKSIRRSSVDRTSQRSSIERMGTSPTNVEKSYELPD